MACCNECKFGNRHKHLIETPSTLLFRASREVIDQIRCRRFPVAAFNPPEYLCGEFQPRATGAAPETTPGTIIRTAATIGRASGTATAVRPAAPQPNRADFINGSHPTRSQSRRHEAVLTAAGIVF